MLLIVACAVPALLAAQAKPDTAKKAPAHDHAKMMVDSAKKTAAPAMSHDMSSMKHDMSAMKNDSGMKHEMSGMKMDSGMKGMMGGMKGGMMGGMKGGMMGEMKSGWGELDAFHTLLMSTWHPAEKDSLSMARSLAATLAAAADAWAGSKGPASCDNADLRKALPAIVADAKRYAASAAKASDADVKAALKKVHDGFEAVGEPCIHAAMKDKMGGMKGMMGDMKDMKGMKGGMSHDMGGMKHDMSAMDSKPAPTAKKP